MADADAPAKKPSDLVKTYVLGMGLIALVLLVAWWKMSGDRDAYREANESAARIFGTARPSGAALPDRPTTITGYAIGVLKYLQTWKEAKDKSDVGTKIPLQPIKDRASGEGLSLKSTPAESSSKVSAKGYSYEEVYATFTFEPANLDGLAKFLYNYESSTPKYRVLDLRWSLKAEKENPIVPGVSPGNLIQSPTVKIGYRRPITARQN